jgi:hypothetical protein
LLIKSDSFC